MGGIPQKWPMRPMLVFLGVFLWTLILNGQTAVAQTNQSGAITGIVHNGTTNEPAPAGTTVTLHAYNSSYTSTETLKTTLDADGRFQFNLNDKPNDWVYLVSATYQELSFSSNIAPLRGDQPLDLSLTVYEPTTDPAHIVIDQLQISLNFVGQEAQVSELYTLGNEGTAVFVGSADNSESGTVQINLPEAARAPTFERGMGPNSGFFPAAEFIERDGRWYHTIALRPGPNSLTLRVTYRLPLAAGLDLSRPLPYRTNHVMVALPDDGLTFTASGWQQQSTQSVGERGVVLSYAQDDFAAESQLALTFSRASLPLSTSSNVSSTAGEWIVSLGILLLLTAVAFRLLRLKAQPATMPQLAAAGTTPPPHEPDRGKRQQLLFALADLDNAYKNGQLTEAAYRQQRQEIKNQLRNIWEIV